MAEEVVETNGKRFESKEAVVEALSKTHNLAEADLSHLDLSGVMLAGGEMAGVDLSHSQLTGAKLAGLNLVGANLSHAQFENGLVAGVNLEKADLSQANMEKARFVGVNLGDVDFSGANLRDTTWLGTNVAGVDFSTADLTGARASAVSWKSAEVPPVEAPAALIPPWIPLLVGGVFVLLLALLIGKRRKQD